MSQKSPALFECYAAPLSQEPAWFQALRQQSRETLAALPMPSRKDEAWRFADLSLQNFEDFRPATASKTTVPDGEGLENPGAKIVLSNDRLVSRTNRTEAKIYTLTEALALNDARIQQSLEGARSELGSAKFVALHQTHFSEAVVIVIGKNQQIEQPIEIFHWLSGAGSAVFPRTIVIAGENSAVTILEHHLSVDDEAGLSCGMAQFHAEPGAKITYVLAERRNESTKSLHFSRTFCAKDSQVIHCLANLGAAWSRTEAVSHLTGSGSRSDMLSVSLTDGSEENDQRTLQLHEAPHATSDLLYKNVLFGKSRGIFAGLIRVDEGAHYTDAYQTCRNLLMTDECEANAMPGLEINADQVKCSHGSTSGAISPEEIFYFESRGVPEATARAMLAQGFLAQVLERLGNDDIRAFLERQIEARFRKAARMA